MSSRKNIFVRTICLATTLITFAFFAFGCGSATADAPEKEEPQETQEIVNVPTEPAPQIESEVAEQPEESVEPTELPEESEEPERPILFRISIPIGEKVYATDTPSDKEYSEFFLVDEGMEFDVYEIFENEFERETFYEIKMDDGRREFLRAKDVQIIE